MTTLSGRNSLPWVDHHGPELAGLGRDRARTPGIRAAREATGFAAPAPQSRMSKAFVPI